MLENKEGDLTHWPKPNLKLRKTTFQSIEDVYYCQLMSAVLYKAEPYKHEFLLVGCKAPKYSGVIFFFLLLFLVWQQIDASNGILFQHSLASFLYTLVNKKRDFCTFHDDQLHKMIWHQYLKPFPVISQNVSNLTHSDKHSSVRKWCHQFSSSRSHNYS